MKSSILVVSNHKVSIQLLKPRLHNYHMIECKDAVVDVRRMVTQKKPSAVIVFDDIKDLSYVSLFKSLLMDNIPIIFVYRTISPMAQQFIGEVFFKTVSHQQVFSNVNDIVSLLIRFSQEYSKIENENVKLRNKLETNRLVNDAKIHLIQSKSMTEQESYSYIQKLSMDNRWSKAVTAKWVLDNIKRD